MWKWSGQSDEMQISGPVLKSVTNIESLSMQQTMDMWDAAEKGELEVLKILFKKKPGHLNAQGAWGRTPLHWTCLCGHFAATEFLLQSDAIVDCVDDDFWSPLHWATNNGHIPIVACLLKYKAKPDMKDKWGKIPLDYCKDSIIGKLLRGEKVKISTIAKAAEYKGETNPETGAKEGKGISVDDQENRYEGTFKNDKKRGFGKMIYCNGDIYEGEWKDDQKHGRGTQSYWDDSGSYTGGWRNNVCHGVGIFRWPDGSKTMRDYFNGSLVTEKKLNNNDEKQMDMLEQVRKLKEEQQKQKELYEQEVTQLKQESANFVKNNGAKLEEYQAKIDVEQTKNLCIICMDKPRNTVLMPCMHFLYCSACIQTLKENQCPSCRQPIHGKLQCNLQP